MKTTTITIGTGVYFVKVELKRQIPNVLPIQGKRIKVWYQGVKIQCNNCYGYHKKETKVNCQEKSFNKFKEDFMGNNPNIPLEMCSSKKRKLEFKPECGDTDLYSFLDELEDEENDVEQKTETEKQKEKQDKQDEEMDATDYTNEDILRLLDEPCNLSTDEKEWLMSQGCETEEEVFTKCRELLKRRDNGKIV